MHDESTLLEAAYATIPRLIAAQITLSIAESVTGGGFHYYCASVPGASASLLGGANVYSAATKQLFTGVSLEFLAAHSTVSAATSAALAQGIRARTGSRLGMGVTGNAGPAAEGDAPVGTIYWALADESGVLESTHTFTGERHGITQDAVRAGFALLTQWLDAHEVPGG